MTIDTGGNPQTPQLVSVPRHVDGSKIRVKRTIPKPPLASNADAAPWWLQFGFRVIPIVPGEKRPAVKWDQWLSTLSPETIAAHWAAHPDHDVGCILGDSYIVLDADSPQAEEAVVAIEKRFNVRARLVIKTRQGSHRYYLLAADAFAKSDSHSTELHPERIDVKTGRACVVLPPSAGREIQILEAAGASELSIVGQDFVDAVAAHNGRPAPRPYVGNDAGASAQHASPLSPSVLEKLLDYKSADCGYEDWLHVLMAIYHATAGSDDGLALADRWSRKSAKYKGAAEIRAKWRSFQTAVSKPVTIATLIKMARDAGADIEAIMRSGHADFEPCDYACVDPGLAIPGVPVEAQAETPARVEHPLAQYSLQGRVPELEKQMVEEVAFLGAIALLGQATVIYAKANTGKTLLVLFLIIDGIKRGLIEPSNLIYVNMDDNSTGLVEKVRLADEFGFHMVADGHQGFEAKAIRAAIVQMVESDSVCGTIIVLDTLKKFVNTMDKAKSSEFARVVRQFVLKGGTVVALAHANKNPGLDGKTVYSGTTDIVDDFDCAFTVTTVSQEADKGQKVVEFVNIKRRGNVALSAAYSFALERDIPYNELLLSVHELDPTQLVPIKLAAEVTSDAEVITAIDACLRDGVNTKMKLAAAAAERARVSRRVALRVIEKYAGDDPQVHRWRFVVRDRGAKVFEALGLPVDGSGTSS